VCVVNCTAGKDTRSRRLDRVYQCPNATAVATSAFLATVCFGTHVQPRNPPSGSYVRCPLFKIMFSSTINFRVLHSNSLCHRTDVILRHNYVGKVEENVEQEWNERSMLAVTNKMSCVLVVCCAGEMKNESNKKD